MKAFTPTEREWGVTDLARRLGIAKSTAHRLLATLTDEGLLEQDPSTGRYRLGLVVFDLAAAAQSVDLHEAVLSPMTELRNRTGETVQVAVLDGREVVYVERLDSPQHAAPVPRGRTSQLGPLAPAAARRCWRSSRPISSSARCATGS